MEQWIAEFADSRGLVVEIDRPAALIGGVKILGLTSRNRRTYLPQALEAAIGLYEGAKVNVNHPRGHAQSPRDYQDRIGALRRVRFTPGAGLFADLAFNPRHALAEQLLWDAEHAPENVGLSHNVQARTSLRDGQTIVESIAAVHSVDLVADPATTSGLFEDLAPPAELFAWPGITADELRWHRPDLVRELLANQEAHTTQLRSQVDALEARLALAERQELIARLLAEQGLPRPGERAGAALLGQHFLETLLHAADEPAVRQLIAQRAALLREARDWTAPGSLARPRSCDQQLAERPARVRTTEDFVRAIT